MARDRKRRRTTYPSVRVYRAVLALRRQGRRVENYCRDRHLHVLDNAIFEEQALVALAFPSQRPDVTNKSRSVPE